MPLIWRKHSKAGVLLEGSRRIVSVEEDGGTTSRRLGKGWSFNRLCCLRVANRRLLVYRAHREGRLYGRFPSVDGRKVFFLSSPRGALKISCILGAQRTKQMKQRIIG